MDKTYTLNCQRIVSNSKGTISILGNDHFRFRWFILEDPIRKVKIKGKTAISTGQWQLYKKTASRFMAPYKARFGHKFCIGMFPLFDQPKDLTFKHIMLHSGNTVENTAGCFLIGNSANFKTMTIGRSYEAYKEFYNWYSNTLDSGYDNVVIKLHQLFENKDDMSWKGVE